MAASPVVAAWVCSHVKGVAMARERCRPYGVGGIFLLGLGCYKHVTPTELGSFGRPFGTGEKWGWGTQG
jgi:hypothetical protein